MAAPNGPIIIAQVNGAADPSDFPRTRKLLEDQHQANQQQAQALQEWHQQLQAREQAVNARELELEEREAQADMWETLEEQRALDLADDAAARAFDRAVEAHDAAPSAVDSPIFMGPVQAYGDVLDAMERLGRKIHELDAENVEIGPPKVKPDANSRCHLCDQRFDYHQGERAVVLSKPGKPGRLFHEQCLQWFTHSVEPSGPRVPRWALHATCGAVFSTWALWVWWLVERATT